MLLHTKSATLQLIIYYCLLQLIRCVDGLLISWAMLQVDRVQRNSSSGVSG